MRPLWRITVFFASLVLTTFSLHAQTSPTFRIGLIDRPDGSLANGVRLAVEEINASGGLTGADGTTYLLDIVLASDENTAQAIANLAQARVIAVIGPVGSNDVLANLSALQSLNVPILTPATDDAITVQDTSGRILRLRAAELVVGRALATYLVQERRVGSIATVLLDIESTVGMIGFTTSLRSLGITPLREVLLQGGTTLEQMAEELAALNPKAIVVYGSSSDTASLYVALRSKRWQGIFATNRLIEPGFRALIPAEALVGVVGATTWAYASPDKNSTRFLADYVRAFGVVPDAIAAAGHDGVYLIARAIEQPGDLLGNLSRITNFSGVQGLLSPALLGRGEISSSAAVVEAGPFGAPSQVVRYANGQRLPDDELIVQPEQPTATPTPQGVFVTITRSVQNVRTGPGTQYDVLGQLRQGDTAQVIGASLDLSWVVISFRGQNGWLSRDILTLTGDTNTVPVVTAPPTPTPPPATPTPLFPPTPTLQPQPDIVILSATPNRLFLGQPFAVTVTVRNNGASNAGTFAVAAGLMPGNVYSAVNLPGLSAGQQTVITLTGTLPPGTSGPQSVVIVADLNNEVDEGPAGEANNNTFFYNYIADAPLLPGSPGSLTIGDGGTVSLDGGTPDIQWQSGILMILGSTQLVLLGGFTSFDAVHYNAITSAPLASTSLAGIAPGQLIGIKTDGGAKFGVLQITGAAIGGNLSLNFRMYN
ncbi:MAG: ABC transporter substrate-binding protein [Anaerolineae bacterium]|nr:ABC transporter substrate-binding protein [Anaerolineae bacterium]MDW8173190.1 ABC transporter substrate-binding protein [Anaerolineae bacterium]